MSNAKRHYRLACASLMVTVVTASLSKVAQMSLERDSPFDPLAVGFEGWFYIVISIIGFWDLLWNIREGMRK